jgi:putative oxidoreductase
VRAGIGLAFVYFGTQKFPSASDSEWVQIFQQIGAGQWFRYFTGVVETLGGVLVFIPWTANLGLLLLACTMASAVLIMAFVIGSPAFIVSGAFIIGLSMFLIVRRSR